MAQEKDNWIRVAFKNNKVWAETDGKGSYLLKNNRVRIKYNLDQTHEYLVYEKSLGPVESIKKMPKKTKKSTKEKNSQKTLPKNPEIPENAITIYTDGATSGNPGPSGIGAVLQYKDHEKKISKYIGTATNNIAELTAIFEALCQVKNKNLPVRVFTDSTYAYGVLFQGWKISANKELVLKTQKEIKKISDLKCFWVKGHSDNPGNELADKLATDAIKKAKKSGGSPKELGGL